ncbi:MULTISPECIES: NUDIX hydrolase [unclassified Brevibacterium]|uniref:NUDIX hydrolase n=1 Tax=unclassified Brevibacterium TaxID=2614124 RepID=UPI0010922353|nr:NUDIX domain-containing protein [Brevibacterium sp. S22]TGD33000.1 NUDIX domain-containing protein [Brevibacterium sp. S22]
MIDLATARQEVGQGPQTPFSVAFAELFDRQGDDSLHRAGGEHHVTASCLVVDPLAEAVLLNHHRKAGLWGQFGGHLEPDDVSLRGAARREAEEESGLHPLTRVTATPIDLHVHDLSAAFGVCTRHFDVVYAAQASTGDSPRVSDESFDVAWFELDRLPGDLMPDLPDRLPGLYRSAVAALSPRG